MKYNVYGKVVGSKFIGTFEADSEREAMEKAGENASISLCHYCSGECENAEIEDFTAEVVE